MCRVERLQQELLERYGACCQPNLHRSLGHAEADLLTIEPASGRNH